LILDASDEQLVAFHGGIYLDAFAAQHEPLEIWQRARRGELRYEIMVRLVVDDDGIAGGIVLERYPRTRCGLLTYMVVAPRARGQGLGKQLVDDALARLHDAPAVYGEVNDPQTQTREPVEVAQRRLAMFERWGARLVDLPYVQPALAPGLAPDETLRLIAWRDPDPVLAQRFVDEFREVIHTGHSCCTS
jgi:GNAT superfamily N-acetyltransferase